MARPLPSSLDRLQLDQFRAASLAFVESAAARSYHAGLPTDVDPTSA